MPVNRGSNNFDVIRNEYYRDREVAFEAFRARTIFPRGIHLAIWATGYDFPAVKDGRVKRETLPDERLRRAGWFINTRRDKFKDPRVREALDLAFDFEWTNKTIFYGAYTRTRVLFPEFRHEGDGPAVADELALLEPFRDKLPAEVFGEPFVAAGVGRLGPRPHAAAQAVAAAAARPACRSRTASG